MGFFLQVDWWDNNSRRVVNFMERQKCDDRDLCYLGPIVSRSLNGPWERKWMCGPVSVFFLQIYILSELFLDCNLSTL